MIVAEAPRRTVAECEPWNEVIVPEPVAEKIIVTVDYNVSVAEMIKRGNYDWHYKHFPKTLNGEGVRQFEIGFEDSEQTVFEKELISGGFEHLLALGAKRIISSLTVPVVALGFQQEGWYPCIDRFYGHRRLATSKRIDGEWPEGTKFLTINAV